MNSLKTYLGRLREIRASGAGVSETSYYTALSNLFDAVGGELKPEVRFIPTVRNQGGGIPDGGFFTGDQLRHDPDIRLDKGEIPERGVVEVKGTGDDLLATARGKQVRKYLDRYGQVLVTNLRSFVLVMRGEAGEPSLRERFDLAESEDAFWAASPEEVVAEHGERFEGYLKRAMMHAATLALPRDLAWFLASYARDALGRVEGADLPALSELRSALEEALGLKFEGESGEHFFRSTLVQTLFYGVFSTWVLWSKQNPPGSSARFSWRDAQWSLRVPMIRTLFEQLSMRSKLEPLGLIEVLDWTGDALDRVDRASFFANFEEGEAVQYFYEPFLEAFDPELRKQLGVWYTPPEVVEYMVERVDAVLRKELDLPDGLADPDVYILDPCTGTGSYLVAALRRIGRTLDEKGEDAFAAHELKEAAMKRMFGFEILPAPFVVAHLQLGLLLQNRGAPLSEENDERVGVYLTNALTGWDVSEDPKRLPFEELEEERDAAEEIKREKKILVVLGNPPYNAFAGVSPAEEKGLVEPYKNGLYSEWGVGKFNLDDLYVRFFRMAERRVAEMTRRGVVCFISNHSYLSNKSFVVMRERFLGEFDEFWFDAMNGDSRETGKRTPEGKSDPSVFSTEYNREGIQVGTAIGLMVRKDERLDNGPNVRFREFWGANKRAELLESLDDADFDAAYDVAEPKRDNYFSFRPSLAAAHYLSWPKLTELCRNPPMNGLMEKRAGALIDADRTALEERMRAYHDKNVDWETLEARGTGLTKNAARFNAKDARNKVLNVRGYEPENLRRYAVRPFENRWCYYSDVRPLWNEPRPALWAQTWEGNSFLMSRVTAEKNPEGPPFYFTRHLSDDHFLAPDASCFPVRIRDDFMAGVDSPPEANLSSGARGYLAALGAGAPDADESAASLVWMHALAVGYSPAYLDENEDGVRRDWPRVPLPAEREALLASAELGGRVAALLDVDRGVSGVTAGALRPEMKTFGQVSREDGGTLDLAGGDLLVSASWGARDNRGAVMPKTGRVVVREYDAEELAAIEAGAAELGLGVEEATIRLGETTCDVYLNDRVCWKNIPSEVWGYVVGGYQPIKKWLSYRDRRVLERPLEPEEAREVSNMARRISALRLIEPELDENYEAAKRSSYPWPAA